MEWYTGVLKNYFGFDGRARRKEYWMFTLFNSIVMVVLMGAGVGLAQAGMVTIGASLYPLYMLAVAIPSIAVSIRRLHDTGRSGWFLLVSLIPIVGLFIALFFLIQDSQAETNDYGPNPKGA